MKPREVTCEHNTPTLTAAGAIFERNFHLNADIQRRVGNVVVSSAALANKCVCKEEEPRARAPTHTGG